MRYWNLKVNTWTFIWKQYLVVMFKGISIKNVISRKLIRYLLLIIPGLCDWLLIRNVWVWDGLELPGSWMETLMVYIETWCRDSYHTFILPKAFLPMYMNDTIAAVMMMTIPTLKLPKRENPLTSASPICIFAKAKIQLIVTFCSVMQMAMKESSMAIILGRQNFNQYFMTHISIITKRYVKLICMAWNAWK